MFNWTLEYTISQVLIVIVYILICLTYFLRNRRKIWTVVFQGVVLLFIAVIPFLLFRTPGLIYSLKLEDVYDGKISKNFVINPATLQGLCLKNIDKRLKNEWMSTTSYKKGKW